MCAYQITLQKGIDMNLIKNMEVVFVTALVVAGFASYASADVRTAPMAATPAAMAAQIGTSDQIATVVVRTKRLTAAEKARLGS